MFEANLNIQLMHILCAQCCETAVSQAVGNIELQLCDHGSRELDVAPGFSAQPVTRPGKPTKNEGKSQFFMGKSTISMAMFNSYVSHYQRVYPIKSH